MRLQLAPDKRPYLAVRYATTWLTLQACIGLAPRELPVSIEINTLHPYVLCIDKQGSGDEHHTRLLLPQLAIVMVSPFVLSITRSFKYKIIYI